MSLSFTERGGDGEGGVDNDDYDVLPNASVSTLAIDFCVVRVAQTPARALRDLRVHMPRAVVESNERERPDQPTKPRPWPRSKTRRAPRFLRFNISIVTRSARCITSLENRAEPKISTRSLRSFLIETRESTSLSFRPDLVEPTRTGRRRIPSWEFFFKRYETPGERKRVTSW